MNWLLFITTYWLISLIPGLNMTLALSLGMSIGLKRVQPMLLGAIFSLGIVGWLCAALAGIILSANPLIFRIFTSICAIYLLYIAYTMWRTSTKARVQKPTQITRKMLFWQGFMCSLSNPKAWAFFVSFIPPFLDKNNPFGTHLYILLAIMMTIEYLNLLLYATGGAVLSKILTHHATKLEKISAIMIALLATLMLLDRF